MMFCHFCGGETEVHQISLKQGYIFICKGCALELRDNLDNWLNGVREIAELRRWAREKGLIPLEMKKEW